MASLPAYIKVLNAALPFIQSKNKPILVLGHGRSGTTWIGNTLSKAENTLLYNEPCNPYLPKNSPISKLWFQFLTPDDTHPFFERNLYNAYNGRIDMHSSVWFRDKKKLISRFNSNHRIIIKEVASVMNIDWLEHHYPSELLFVLRHPCSVALSEYERNIDGKKSLEYLLENEKLIDLFSDDEKKYFSKAKHPFEFYGLIWSIRNKPFSLKLKDNEDIPHVFYEKLASNPVDEFQKIFSLLNLQWSEQVESYILKNTTKEVEGHYKTTKNAQEHIDRWKTILSNEQIDQVKQFTLPFNLGFYSESHFE